MLKILLKIFTNQSQHLINPTLKIFGKPNEVSTKTITI